MTESPVAVLTGGAQGLGAAICKVLLDKGYKVCVSDILEEKGKLFVKEQQNKYGAENVKFVVCDVTKEEDYERLFQFAKKEFKEINLVLNNAGTYSEQNPRKTIEVNLIGPIIGCQLALKYMGKSNGGKGGMVINTASMGGFKPHHGSPVYRASKHGVIGLTRSYGTPYHLERDGVMFTAICPGHIDTELLRNICNNAIAGHDPYKQYAHLLMPPEYVAQGILKLLDDKINGSTLAVTKKRGFFYVGIQEELKEYE